jgi:hypothetical protein
MVGTAVRRKLRLALLVTLATLSGLCAALIPVSFVRVPAITDRWLIYVAFDSGAIIINGVSRPVEEPIDDWFVQCPRNEKFGRLTLQNVAHSFVDWYWDAETVGGLWADGTGVLYAVSLPLWVLTVAFGLWPSIIAVKAVRRRKTRGFEVTPAADGRDPT